MTNRYIPQETDPLLRPRGLTTQKEPWICKYFERESLIVSNSGSTARDQLGYERTFLVWIRFAILLVGFGVSILCHSDKDSPYSFYPSLDYGLTLLIAIFYLSIGIITVLLALFSYLLLQYTHATTRAPIPPRHSMSILFVITTASTVAVTITLLCNESAKQ